MVCDGSGTYYNNVSQTEQILKTEIINRKKKIIQNKLNNIKKDFK